jgi:hypothetical protein
MQINITIVLAPPYPASCIRHCIYIYNSATHVDAVSIMFMCTVHDARPAHFIPTGCCHAIPTAREQIFRRCSKWILDPAKFVSRTKKTTLVPAQRI